MLGTNVADKYTSAVTKGNFLVVIIGHALHTMSLSIILHVEVNGGLTGGAGSP